MTVFLTTLGLIGAAEMGDKTQLLTLALAARLPLGAVLGGVVVATLLNHALAVVVGGAALLVVPASVLRAAAGLSFIGFGLWTLRGDQLAGNEERRVGPPLVTVAVSFFLAEMGDKTQLATAVLAAQATSTAVMSDIVLLPSVERPCRNRPFGVFATLGPPAPRGLRVGERP